MTEPLDLFEGLPDPDQHQLATIVVGEYARVLYQNDAAKRLIGKAGHSKPLTELCPNQAQELMTWLQQHDPTPLRIIFQQETGSRLTVLKQHVFSGRSDEQITLLTVQPVAHRNSPSSQLDFYQTVFTASPQAICITARSGFILSCNPAFQRLFRGHKKGLMGCSVAQLLTDSGEKKYCAVLKEIASGRHIKGRALMCALPAPGGQQQEVNYRVHIVQSLINAEESYLHFFEHSERSASLQREFQSVATIDPLIGLRIYAGRSDCF